MVPAGQVAATAVLATKVYGEMPEPDVTNSRPGISAYKVRKHVADFAAAAAD